MAGERATTEGVAIEAAACEEVVRRRRRLYGLTFALIAGFLALVALDVTGAVEVVGVQSEEASDGELRVQYPTVARPALALPLRAHVTRPGGFGEAPVVLRIDRRWLELGDLNGVYPAPSAETSDGRWLEWEFDPPPGDRFDMAIDFRVEPATQGGRDGAIELRDGDRTTATVEWHTRVMP